MLSSRSPGVLAPILIGIAMAGVPDRLWSQSVERTVYVSVLNQAGVPVTDLAARDVVVREGNTEREVLRVSPATEPLDIAVLVDNSQEAEPFIGDFRRGLVEFFKAIDDRHQIAVIGFGQRPTVLVDYTHDLKRLEGGTGRVFAQAGSGAYLLDGIIETVRGLQKRENSRRALVVISSEGQEFSNRYSREVLDDLRQSGAIVEAFVIVDRSAASRTFDTGTPRQPPEEAATLSDQGARERELALSEAARITGGRRQDLLTSMALGGRLRELAAELNKQYRVVYARPPALIPPDSIEIQTRRPELRVRATRIPPN